MAQQSSPFYRKPVSTASGQRLNPPHICQPTPVYDGKHHRPPPPTIDQHEAPMFTSFPAPRHQRRLPPDPLKPLRAPFGERVAHDYSPFRACLEILIHVIYPYFLLGLPQLYARRLTKISKQVDLHIPEIKQTVLEMSAHAGHNRARYYSNATRFNSDNSQLLHKDLKDAWDSFLNSLLREWTTINVISILLLTAILAILQIQSAADDPLTRFPALLSLICAFISVSYGCMYTIRFDGMRETCKAVEWTLEAKKKETSIFWNVRVLLAMPLVWLSWSILLFIFCFVSFLWRTGTTASSQSPPIVTAHDILWPRITITATILLGFGYFLLIFITFRHYGNGMDEAWDSRVKNWLLEADTVHVGQGTETKPGVAVDNTPTTAYKRSSWHSSVC